MKREGHRFGGSINTHGKTTSSKQESKKDPHLVEFVKVFEFPQDVSRCAGDFDLTDETRENKGEDTRETAAGCESKSSGLVFLLSLERERVIHC